MLKFDRDTRQQINRQVSRRVRAATGFAVNTATFSNETTLRLLKHMERGHSFASFAGVLKVTPARLREWLEEYPEFQLAREVGEMSQLYGLEVMFFKAKSAVQLKRAMHALGIFHAEIWGGAETGNDLVRVIGAAVAAFFNRGEHSTGKLGTSRVIDCESVEVREADNPIANGENSNSNTP